MGYRYVEKRKKLTQALTKKDMNNRYYSIFIQLCSNLIVFSAFPINTAL